MNSRAKIKQYIQRREEMEKEMEQIIQTLDQSGVGLHGPLVDRQGFPRNDVDLNLIRTLRHQYACFQTDYKELTQQIETSMNELFEAEKNTSTVVPSVSSTSHNVYDKSIHGAPFLQVNDVAVNSPAAKSGLLKNDQIIQFGSITREEIQSNGLKILSQYVEQRLNQIVAVKIKREDSVLLLDFIPQVWSGRGYLGCLLVPIQH